MGLFDQIINALDSPDREATPGQMDNIFGTVQQVSNNYGADPSTVQSAMSLVGNYVRSALQQKQATAGPQQAQALVNQYGGSSPNPQAVDALFGFSQVPQIVQVIAQRTGLNPAMIQQMLPILVPLVLNLLKTGSSAQNPHGSNPVLNTFLDADRDGDVDIADAMQLAARHLGR
ncbi:MAG: DUF937 domain-containing protein [Cyanobacteriota bacterium]